MSKSIAEKLGQQFQEAKKNKNAETMSKIRTKFIVLARQGMSQTFIAKQCGITQGTVSRWVKNTKQDIKVGFRYGRTIRYDVRTKCIAIKEYVENQVSIDDLAETYNVSGKTIYNWIKKFGTSYVNYLDAPSGIATLAHEDRLIYGEEAIETVRECLNEELSDLTNIMIKIQEYGLSDNEVKSKVKALRQRIKHIN